MKNKLLLLLLVVSIFTLTACTKKDSIIFKEQYESLNGTTNSNGKAHREVTIPKKNPIIISDAKGKMFAPMQEWAIQVACKYLSK